MSLKDELKAFTKKGTRFANVAMFEMFLETNYPAFIRIIKESISSISPDDIKRMIRDDEYPEMPLQTYKTLQGYAEYVNRIDVKRLWKAITLARPDLADAIDQANGYHWFVRFRQRLLQGIAAGHPIANRIGESSVGMVGVTCDKCHKTTVMKITEASKLTACPFCGASASDPPSPETESRAEY
ncbi:MAG: hypothetical protein PHQ43_08520 [Dehalococcoidales bacterium]|nr:hypothetical protein [Dehalococcoidales bacterium]